MNLRAPPLHAAKPGHLPLGKLMNGDFQLTEHLVVGQLADDILRDVLVFQPIINKVIRLHATVKQAPYLLHHAIVETLPQSGRDLPSSLFPVDVHTDDKRGHRRHLSQAP